MHCRPGLNARRSFARRGFTLIELLISMTITLIMVYALVEFMKYVGDTVTEGRGQIEMAGSIRSVRRQLYRDLQLVTVYLKPSPDIDGGNGYVEYVEGLRSDSDNDGDDKIDVNNSTADRDANGIADSGEGKGPYTGDTDDVLGMTVRSPGNPYSGVVDIGTASLNNKTKGTITSELAEVVWFTSHFDFNTLDPSDPGLPPKDFSNPDSTRIWLNSLADRGECTLYRRVLLIRPDLNTAYDSTTDTYYLPDVDTSLPSAYSMSDTSYPTLYSRLVNNFWQANDISARIVSKPLAGGGFRNYIVANALGDLSIRENRFARVNTFNTTMGSSFREAPGNSIGMNVTSLRCDNSARLIPFILKNSRWGEDALLAHVTAFDLRAFDPNAVVRTDSGSNTPLTPGDPGYFRSTTTDVGTGAFVDLGYQRSVYDIAIIDPSYRPLTAIQISASGLYWPATPVVNQTPLASAGPTSSYNAFTMLLCTYDTWSFTYEHDGINQDDIVNPQLIDEGTDGLDNDNQNGVDDPGERETFPPYPVVLQGLQARIRVYDHSLRIGRQATVVAEFTK